MDTDPPRPGGSASEGRDAIPSYKSQLGIYPHISFVILHVPCLTLANYAVARCLFFSSSLLPSQTERCLWPTTSYTYYRKTPMAAAQIASCSSFLLWLPNPQLPGLSHVEMHDFTQIKAVSIESHPPMDSSLSATVICRVLCTNILHFLALKTQRRAANPFYLC